MPNPDKCEVPKLNTSIESPSLLEYRLQDPIYAPQSKATKMLSRSVIRASTASRFVARRGFHSSPARFSSPYHYPEGPGSNLPFQIKTKYFALRYWGTMAFAFGLPFMIAIWQTYKNKP